jgi:hypothetical protein
MFETAGCQWTRSAQAGVMSQSIRAEGKRARSFASTGKV